MARFSFQGKEVTAQPSQTIPTNVQSSGSSGSGLTSIDWIVDGQTIRGETFVQQARPLDQQATQLWDQYLTYYNQVNPSQQTQGTSSKMGSTS